MSSRVCSPKVFLEVLCDRRRYSASGCARRVSLANLGFHFLSVGITACALELLAESLSFLIALSSSLYLAVTFSHRIQLLPLLTLQI